jgi:hypothetical protein
MAGIGQASEERKAEKAHHVSNAKLCRERDGVLV